MRTLLSVAHCYGSILGTSWHLILTTLQHLVWIIGFKPSTGGTLKHVGIIAKCPPRGRPARGQGSARGGTSASRYHDADCPASERPDASS